MQQRRGTRKSDSEIESKINVAHIYNDEDVKPIPFHLNFKLGAFLVNLMVRNLTY